MAIKKYFILFLALLLVFCFSLSALASVPSDLVLLQSSYSVYSDGVYILPDISLSSLPSDSSFYFFFETFLDGVPVSFGFWGVPAPDAEGAESMGLMVSFYIQDGLEIGIFELTSSGVSEFGKNFIILNSRLDLPQGLQFKVSVYGVSESTDFLTVVSNVFYAVFSWIGKLIQSLLYPSGRLFPLFLLLCLGIAISFLFFAVYSIIKIIWGW